MTASAEPQLIVAGDTVNWTRTLADYPAPTWVLTYTLINGTDKETVTAVASGTDHQVAVSASTTAGWSAGIYSWTASVVNGSERFTVDSGTIEVKPDLAAATNYDTRSHIKKTLDAIEAVIEQRASKDQESYTINGRSLSRTPLEDLLKMRDQYRTEYQREVDAEKIANGLGTGRRVLTRFT